MIRLDNRKVLFLAPSFFRYERVIAEKMTEMGAVVDLYDERSIAKSWQKALLKISPMIFSIRTKKYYARIIQNNVDKQYDFIFIIKCEMISVGILRQLKKQYPQAILCLYLYDSLKNIKGIMAKIKEFDRVLSFDSLDVAKHEQMIFRPLFFQDCFQQPRKDNEDYQYDLSFVGTIHSDRYAVIKRAREMAQQKKLKTFFYCYLQSKFMFRFYKMTRPEFRGASLSDFSFKKIESEHVAEIISQSKVILDVQHPNQTGLTMRTIEMLGMNKKLITTNKHIRDYDFFKPQNILVVDRKTMTVPDDFFQIPYETVQMDVYRKYSLEYWICIVLGLEDTPGNE